MSEIFDKVMTIPNAVSGGVLAATMLFGSANLDSVMQSTANSAQKQSSEPNHDIASAVNGAHDSDKHKDDKDDKSKHKNEHELKKLLDKAVVDASKDHKDDPMYKELADSAHGRGSDSDDTPSLEKLSTGAVGDHKQLKQIANEGAKAKQMPHDSNDGLKIVDGGHKTDQSDKSPQPLDNTGQGQPSKTDMGHKVEVPKPEKPVTPVPAPEGGKIDSGNTGTEVKPNPQPEKPTPNPDDGGKTDSGNTGSGNTDGGTTNPGNNGGTTTPENPGSGNQGGESKPDVPEKPSKDKYTIIYTDLTSGEKISSKDIEVPSGTKDLMSYIKGSIPDGYEGVPDQGNLDTSTGKVVYKIQKIAVPDKPDNGGKDHDGTLNKEYEAKVSNSQAMMSYVDNQISQDHLIMQGNTGVGINSTTDYASSDGKTIMHVNKTVMDKLENLQDAYAVYQSDQSEENAEAVVKASDSLSETITNLNASSKEPIAVVTKVSDGKVVSSGTLNSQTLVFNQK